MNFKKEYVVYAFLLLVIGVLGFQLIKLNYNLTHRSENYEFYDEVKHAYTIVYDDSKVKELKKENEELYAQIKEYKEEIDYLVQFKNTTVYVTDTIYCDTSSVDNGKEVKVYEYTNTAKNDTLNYNLQIASTEEPDWYKLNVEVTEEFTIVNRKVDGANTTTITPSHGGTISDVTVHKTRQNTFWDNFAIGPSVTAGYGIINNNFDVVIGVSAVYQIPFKKK